MDLGNLTAVMTLEVFCVFNRRLLSVIETWIEALI